MTTNARPRILVCILAETRSHRLTWESFKQNILDPLDAELALCIATPASYDRDNPFWRHASYRWTCKEYEDFGDAFDFASSEILGTDDKRPDWRILLDVGNQWLGGIKGPNHHPGSAAILIYFRWLLWRNILKEGLQQRFTHFLVTRSDFIWTCRHPDLISIDRHAIWLPNGERWGGLTDRYALLPADALEQYLNLLEEMVVDPEGLRARMSGRNNWNLEKFIDFSIRRRVTDRPIRTFQYFMYSVREMRGSTRWSRGELDPYRLRYIKYPTEYAACLLLKRFLRSCGAPSFDEHIRRDRPIRMRFRPTRPLAFPGSHRDSTEPIEGDLVHNILSGHGLDGLADMLALPVPAIIRPLFPDRFVLRTRGEPFVRWRRGRWTRLAVPPPRQGRRVARVLLLTWLILTGGLFRAEPAGNQGTPA